MQQQIADPNSIARRRFTPESVLFLPASVPQPSFSVVGLRGFVQHNSPQSGLPILSRKLTIPTERASSRCSGEPDLHLVSMPQLDGPVGGRVIASGYLIAGGASATAASVASSRNVNVS